MSVSRHALAVAHAFMAYSIRKERYRFSPWDKGHAGEELYERQIDPREVVILKRNLIFPGYGSRLRQR